jgi:DNA polymerase-1
MAEQFDSIFKKRRYHNQSKSNDDETHPKVQQKSEDQFDLLEVEDESSEENHKYYKTLQDTEHSYQIIQGDLGLKLLLKLIKTKFCLF